MDKRLTKHQQLKLCNQQLKDALESNQASDRLISALGAQLNGRDQHIESLQQVIANLGRQLADKDLYITELETTSSLLRQTNTNLSEQLSLLQELISSLKKEAENNQRQLDKQAKELLKLEKIRQGKKLYGKLLFGRKSERTHTKVIDQQRFIIDDLTTEEQQEAKMLFVKGQFADISKAPNPSIFKQGLEIVTTVMDIPNAENSAIKIIGKKTSYKVVNVPARNYIHKIIRPIYLKEIDPMMGTFKRFVAPLPENHIPKCIADVTLVKQLLADKYIYHMPTNRGRKKLISNGLTMPYNTLNDTNNRGCRMLQPLWELQLREVVKSGYIHCDETSVTVIDKSKQLGKKSAKGQILAMANPVQRIVCFKYIRGRGHIDMQEVLQGFKGYLHTDAYGGYKKFGRQKGVLHGYCLVHARRKFVDCQNSDPKLAMYPLKHFFGPIYAIERQCRDQNLDWDQITEVRQKYTVPILQNFHQWLTEYQAKVKPHKPIADAINYILKIWDGIMLFTTDGMLMPDNNYIEGQIRAIAVGKHSWMFAGSHDAAPNAATMYSLLGTCQLQGINPEIWLSDVLNCIQTYPKHKLADLLPQNWKHLRGTALQQPQAS